MTWDIFCTVVDNYGDIGVTWRLARQLADEHALPVRLWVDDLAAFQQIRPEIDPACDTQLLAGVEVRRWTQPLPEAEPGEVVIEALACNLPEEFIQRMAARQPPPAWLNLEYLSAEDWVAGVHGLPSPHPRLPLTKHFFMPGYTRQTGGLTRERWLTAERDAFQAGAFRRMTEPPSGERRLSAFPPYETKAERDAFQAGADVGRKSDSAFRRMAGPPSGGRRLSAFPPYETKAERDAFQAGADVGRKSDSAFRRMAEPPSGGRRLSAFPPYEVQSDALKISLFSYENAALPGLLQAWASGDRPVCVLTPVGKAMPQIAAWFGEIVEQPRADQSGTTWQRGSLTLHVLPMLDQDAYDRLLWTCDINFVRGEDSFVRAQFAARPMLWQAYVQDEDAHLAKLEAFLDLYCVDLDAATATLIRKLWRVWNGAPDQAEDIIALWPQWLAALPALQAHARAWDQHLAGQPDLATNLLTFCRKWLK
jgi:hypothetical protein